MSEGLVNYLMTVGATRSEAQMIVDLGKHAAEQAIETISRVSQTGPTTLIQQATFSAALRFLQVNLNEVFVADQDTPTAQQYPTEDAYMAACRALHWHTAQLRAHGIEPIRIQPDFTHYPPEDYDFKANERG